VENADIINKMIDDILNGDNVEAEQGVNAVLASKISSALDDRKVEIAQSIYGKKDDEVSQEDLPEEEIDVEEDTTEVE
jgi:hypothetical protein